MPAVAYSDACDFYDDIGDYDYNGNSAGCSEGMQNIMSVHQPSHELLASAAGGANGGGSNIGGGSMMGGGGGRFVGNGSGGGSSGGAGGGPSQRCPKCGANVTFQEASAATAASGMQSNCFYCAACSGWFLIQPNSSEEESTSAHSKYLLSKMAAEGEERRSAGLPTSPSNRKISQPQFVMQHVSFGNVCRSLILLWASCVNIQYGSLNACHLMFFRSSSPLNTDS